MLTSGKKGNKMCSETTHMICTWMVKFSESLLFKQLQRCMSGLEVEEAQLGGCCMGVYPVYPATWLPYLENKMKKIITTF